MSARDQGNGFGRWLAQPESLLALAAVLLSLCGVFIALFEASVMRKTARAAVWPHVEVGASLRYDGVTLFVRNTGVGPALIRAATVSYDGDVVADWDELLDRIPGVDERIDAYFSLIGGRVLPPASSETILRIDQATGGASPAVTGGLRNAFLEGNADIEICYCSVYEQCWTSTLQDLIARSEKGTAAAGAVEVDDCDGRPISAI